MNATEEKEGRGKKRLENFHHRSKSRLSDVTRPCRPHMANLIQRRHLQPRVCTIQKMANTTRWAKVWGTGGEDACRGTAATHLGVVCGEANGEGDFSFFSTGAENDSLLFCILHAYLGKYIYSAVYIGPLMDYLKMYVYVYLPKACI